MDLTRSRTLIDRKYMEYFIPTIANTMATSLSFIVDGIIVSVLLGENAMAAVNACLPVSQIISMAAALFGLGASGRISVAFGRRERDAANRAFTALLTLLLCGGILLTAAQLALFAPITRLLLKNETLAPLISEYYRTLAWGTPFMLLMPAIAHLMRAEGQAKLASSVILIGNAANLILDVVFIRVFQMGIGGASGMFLHRSERSVSNRRDWSKKSRRCYAPGCRRPSVPVWSRSRSTSSTTLPQIWKALPAWWRFPSA